MSHIVPWWRRGAPGRAAAAVEVNMTAPNGTAASSSSTANTCMDKQNRQVYAALWRHREDRDPVTAVDEMTDTWRSFFFLFRAVASWKISSSLSSTALSDIYSIRHQKKIARVSMEFWCTINDDYCIHVPCISEIAVAISIHCNACTSMRQQCNVMATRACSQREIDAD